MNKVTLINADAAVFPYPDDHFDGLVTDPPYGLKKVG